MAYKYSETRKHILTPELILNDLKKDNKEAKVMSIFLLILPPFVALVFTAVMSLVSDDMGAVLYGIICGSVWLGAVLLMAVSAIRLKDSCKALKPSDIHIVKCRLETIAYNEAQRTWGRDTVYRDVFYLEGMGKYFPTATQVALAEEGDEYYVVTRGEGSTHPIRIYRADAYIWNG